MRSHGSVVKDSMREQPYSAFGSSDQLSTLEQEQGSQFALRVQKIKMLPVDFSALCDDGLRADLGRFEPE